METNRVFVWRQRIGYGMSDFACNLIWQMITLYLLYFYTDVMNLDPLAVSLMFLVTRIIDGGTDLLVGYWIDHTHTRWGKSRPFFLFGAVPFALFAILAFSVPSISDTAKLVYAYITYIGLSFAYTVVNIPMASILPSLTSNAKERTVLASSRIFFSSVGSLLVGSLALPLVGLWGGDNEALGFRLVMMLFGCIGCAAFFITFFNVRETTVQEGIERASFKDALRSLGSNRPWIVFAVNILFMWTGYFIQSAAVIYYYAVVLRNKNLSVTITTMMFVVPTAANLCVPFLSQFLSKRNLFIASTVVQIVGIGLIAAAGSLVPLVIAGVLISALGAGIKTSIYFSMQADPVDYGIWKTGVNTAGTLSAINGFLGKIAQAVSGLAAGILLKMGQYDSSLPVQPAGALAAISAMYLYIPVLLFVLSIFVMMFYDLDKIYPRIKAELESGTRE